MDRCWDYEVFLQCLLVAIPTNNENSSVSNSEVHKADEIGEVRLVGENDDELDEVSEVS